MRLISLVILLLFIVSCSEHLVETDQLTKEQSHQIGSDESLKIIGDNITSELANKLSQRIQNQLNDAELVGPQSTNEKSWGDIAFVPITKKKGYFWDNIGANTITYQSYAIHYINPKQSDVDMVMVHQFPVKNTKGIKPFLFETYDLSSEGWQMTCVRAKLYGTDAKKLSKMVLTHNELRVFLKGQCALGTVGFNEDLGWTVE